MTDKETTLRVLVTTTSDCKHENGWYGYVKFWIFRKRYYVCSDCGEFIEVLK